MLRCEAVPAILQTISDKKPCLRKVVFRGHGFFVNNGMESSEEFTLKSQNRKTGQRDASPAAGSGNRAGFVWIDEGLVLIGQELEKMDGWMTGQKSEIRSAKKKEKCLMIPL